MFTTYTHTLLISILTTHMCFQTYFEKLKRFLRIRRPSHFKYFIQIFTMFSRLALPSIPEFECSGAHRIFVIDCSGSMRDSIVALRTQLKNKISMLTQPNDFVSIVYFKHKGSSGIVVEHVSLRNVDQLTYLLSAVDRWLDANGGTYFADAVTLVNNLCKKYPDQPTQMFFMTDGMENERHSLTKQVFQCLPCSVVLVEYGWYTDSAYIKELAQACHGTHLFSSDFDQVMCTFDKYLSNQVLAARSLSFEHQGEAFACVDGELQIWSSFDNKCTINTTSNIEFVYTYHSLPAFEQLFGFSNPSEYYLFLWYAVKTGNVPLVQHLLKSSGDIYYIEKFNNCFSRQDFLNLTYEVSESYKHPEQQFKMGLDHQHVPNDNALTVSTLLKALSSDEECRVWPFHESFKYERISKKTQAEIDRVKKEALTINKNVGCPFRLMYHSSRANINILCTIEGFKTKSSGVLTTEVIFRNFAIVKDGVKHVPILPISMSETSFQMCVANKLIPAQAFEANKVYLLHLDNVPVINRVMTNSTQCNSTEFALSHVKKQELMACRKYLQHRLNKLMEATQVEESEEESESNESEEEGEEDESDSGERSNKRFKTSHPDSYVAKQLQVKVSRCSSLPVINHKLFTKLDSKKKPTAVESFMVPNHIKWRSVVQSSTPEALNDNLIAFAQQELKEIGEKLDAINAYLEQVKFVILAGNMWFQDVSTDRMEFQKAAGIIVTYKNFEWIVKVEVKETRIEL